MRSYGRYYLETFRMQAITDERVATGMHVNFDQADLALEYMKNGRGVIFALPHMGDFELTGRWINGYGAGSFTTVAERLKPESVFQRFLDFRQGLGMEVLPTSGGPHPFGVMAQRLRAGKLVCIVADRDLSDTGVEVDFFGEKALLPAGPAALAVQTGAALMPVACWFVGEDEWGAHIYDEIPVPAEGTRKEKAAAMTQAMAAVFEEGIREHPEDWHMLQKVFVNDLDPERLARSRNRAVATATATGGARGGLRTTRPTPPAASPHPSRAHAPPAPHARPDDRASARLPQAARHADRHRVPVLVGRARRSPAAHQGPGRGADRARPRRLGDRARRRGPAAAALRRPHREGDAGAVQRLGGPALVRPAVDPPGAPLAPRRRLRRAARARADGAVAAAARLLGGVRPDRGDRAHRDAQVPGAARHPAGAPHRA